MLQVYEDLHTIWDWLLTEKLHIPPSARYLFSALVVVPETFDNRGSDLFLLLLMLLVTLELSIRALKLALCELFYLLRVLYMSGSSHFSF